MNWSIKDYKEFSIMNQGQTIESFSVEASDFPLVVRHVKVNDVISMRFGNKNVHRFFVDRKICKIYRKYWLVVEIMQEKLFCSRPWM